VENVGTGKPKRLRDLAEEEWQRHRARGRLLFGQRDHRRLEVMRYVPDVRARWP
jgi:hypothetical protein